MQLKQVKLNPHVIFDFFHFQEESETNENIFTNNYIPTLVNNSVSLITFDDRFSNIYDSYGITDTALGYEFSVYREDNNDNILSFISKLSEGSLSVIDHNVQNNVSYIYYVFKEDANYMSVASLTDSVTTNWWDWSITGFNKDSNGNYYVDPSNIWTFSLNIESGDLESHMSKSVYENLTEKPKISSGTLNYDSGTISCIIGNINNDKYEEPAGLVKQWNYFCSGSELKLLKDRKGNKWIVDIIGTSSNVADESVEQYSMITFNWIEIMYSYEISIIEK